MSEFITNAELRIEAERLCDENEHLREENAKLKRAAERDADVLESLNLSLEESQAENAKLREQIVQLQADWESERDYANQMEAKEKRAVSENDKLRELAAEAIRLMQANAPDCGICKHYDECWTGEAMDYSPSGCVICNEARELGIEAGE